MTEYQILDEVNEDNKYERRRYPWMECEVGGGFRIDQDDPAFKTIRQNVYAANLRFKKLRSETRYVSFKDKVEGCIWVKRVS